MSLRGDAIPTRGKRPLIDWESIEKDYRAGLLSVLEISRQHKISHTLINRKAKEKGWQRDLAARVRKEVSARLVSGGVSKPVSTLSDDEVIETAATKTVEVVRLHQATASKAQREVSALFGELASSDMSLKDKATTANNLSNALKTLVSVERQAHNLDEPPEKDEKLEVSPSAAFAELVDKLEGVARTATANNPAPRGLAGDSEA